MNQFINKVILFIYCIFVVLFLKVDFSFVVSLLTSLFLTAIIYYFNHSRLSFIVTTLYAITAFFYPPLYYFSPILGYDMFQYKNFGGLAMLIVGYGINLFGNKTYFLWILLLGLIIACYLAYNEMSYAKLEQLFKKTRDDSTELNLLLEEKNKHLLEKQDYQIYNATLKERNRIAREIHDNVGHMLSRAILLLGAIKTIHKDDTLTPSLDTLSDTLDTAMNNIRTSVHDLHDESVNLKDVTEGLIQDFGFCPVELEYDMGNVVPREVKYCLIAILKEGLSNIERHSNATHVWVLVREHPGLYQLMIHDNGTQQSALYGKGIGLTNMKDRVDGLNGSMQITQEQGFRIFITLPKQAPINKT